MVAHFDYYYKVGQGGAGTRGVLLIPRTSCGKSKMNSTNTIAGGYIGSIAHTTTCPAIATAIGTVLGSYLLSNTLLLSDRANDDIPSVCGSAKSGATNGRIWQTTQCVFPTEIQIYGCMVCSSSFYDIGEGNKKLSVFNFINANEFSGVHFWFRAATDSLNFAAYDGAGLVSFGGAATEFNNRPLIYIG